MIKMQASKTDRVENQSTRRTDLMTQPVWQVAGLTDKGHKREENQDNFLISDDNHLAVVADGMGGVKGGALASHLVVRSLEESWKEDKPDLSTPDSVATWIETAVARANKAVIEAAQASNENKSMGTTVVVAVLDEQKQLHIAHVGDSRATLVRTSGEGGKRLTNDHSVVMEMHLRGQMTIEQCAQSPFKHLITRCLGHDEEVQADYQRMDVIAGDHIILASDGLSDVVSESEIQDIAGAKECPQEVCDILLETVLSRRAPDNVTIVTLTIKD